MVVGVARTHVLLLLGGKQHLRFKKAALPALKDGDVVLISMTVTKAKRGPRPKPEDIESRRRERWMTREFARRVEQGVPVNIHDLLRRSHLQLVEDTRDKSAPRMEARRAETAGLDLTVGARSDLTDP
jgi:hypothetical protein